MASRRFGLGLAVGLVIACGGSTVDFPDASNQDGGGDATLVCNGGTTACGDKCVQLGIDPNNCGACDHLCSISQVCVNGACETNCPVGYTLCNGLCANLQGDPQNCGKCGNACGGANVRCAVGTECQAGRCVALTTLGLADHCLADGG